MEKEQRDILNSSFDSCRPDVKDEAEYAPLQEAISSVVNEEDSADLKNEFLKLPGRSKIPIPFHKTPIPGRSKIPSSKIPIPFQETPIPGRSKTSVAKKATEPMSTQPLASSFTETRECHGRKSSSPENSELKTDDRSFCSLRSSVGSTYQLEETCSQMGRIRHRKIGQIKKRIGGLLRSIISDARNGTIQASLKKKIEELEEQLLEVKRDLNVGTQQNEILKKQLNNSIQDKNGALHRNGLLEEKVKALQEENEILRNQLADQKKMEESRAEKLEQLVTEDKSSSCSDLLQTLANDAVTQVDDMEDNSDPSMARVENCSRPSYHNHLTSSPSSTSSGMPFVLIIFLLTCTWASIIYVFNVDVTSLNWAANIARNSIQLRYRRGMPPY